MIARAFLLMVIIAAGCAPTREPKCTAWADPAGNLYVNGDHCQINYGVKNSP